MSYDPTVNNDRIVMADLAVSAALGNVPQLVTITAPADMLNTGAYAPPTEKYRLTTPSLLSKVTRQLSALR